MNIDYVPFNLKTDREVFEHIRDHLIEQNQQSLFQSGHCAYRGPDGLSCAIGCIISDENYDELFEDRPATDGEVFNSIQLSNPEWEMTRESAAMVVLLQKMHDNLGPYTWKNDFNLMENLLFEDGSDSVKKGVMESDFEINSWGITESEGF